MSLLAGDLNTQLAFSVYENKGVFAVLAGSGLSRAADIPTGWEITLDLIRRIALAQGEGDKQDWESWYRQKTSEEPNYSALIQELGLSAHERRSILHSYIEPTEDDRSEERKVPTRAHHAIADLVAAGYVRVIVTTNFDRLIENALRDRGIEPTIVASADALNGAEPITHSACYLVKLHGDYKDARILNTDEELSSYSATINKLLERIFDEYGLIVVGWSGTWDLALRTAILRTVNRRYPTFWAARGELSDSARSLISHRGAQVIEISDADEFLTGLKERVETLSQTRRANPLSIQLIVGTAKRYLSKPDHRIQFEDLFAGEYKRLTAAIDGPEFGTNSQPTDNEFRKRVQFYESASEPIATLAGLVGRWGNDRERALAVEAIRGLYAHSQKALGGYTIWLGLRSYPAMLAFDACSLGLVRTENWKALHDLFVAQLRNRHGIRVRAIDTLYLWNWEGSDRGLWKTLEGMGSRANPLSDHLFEVFSGWSEKFASLTPTFELLYGRLEMLSALAIAETQSREYWSQQLSRAGTPQLLVGRLAWDQGVRDHLVEEIKADPMRTEIIKAGFGDGTSEFIDLFAANLQRASRW